MASTQGLKLLIACLLFSLVLSAVLLPACCVGRFRRRRRRTSSASSLSEASQQQPPQQPQQQPQQQHRRPSPWSSRVSVLAAGTLLSVGLLDMFPDAARNLTEAAHAGQWRSGLAVPLAHSLALAGLVLVLTIEQLAATCNRAVILALALSVHSLFEGLALGVEPNLARLIAYFIAVLMHKAVVAVSLGLELNASGIRLRGLLAWSLGFALMSPVGMTTGMLLMSDLENRGDSSAKLAGGLLQSFSSGTFLYVAFFEILPREFGYCTEGNSASGGVDASRLWKLASLVAGFTLVSAYLLLEHALLASAKGNESPPP